MPISICSSSIDWVATGSMLSGIGTIGGALAVACAAYIGRSTFDKWKKQKSEERRMEVAERILTLAYRIKRNLSSIRNPMVPGWETAEAREALEKIKGYGGLSEGRKSRAETGRVVLNRMNSYTSDWDQIFELMPVARALFGKVVEDNLNSLWGMVAKIRDAVNSYVLYHGDDREFEEKRERVIWEGSDEENANQDEVVEKMNTIIDSLEEVLLPIIRPPLPGNHK